MDKIIDILMIFLVFVDRGKVIRVHQLVSINIIHIFWLPSCFTMAHFVYGVDILASRLGFEFEFDSMKLMDRKIDSARLQGVHFMTNCALGFDVSFIEMNILI